MRNGREGLSKLFILVQQGAIDSAWRTMFAFRTKRPRSLECKGNDNRKNPEKTVGSLFFALATELQICILRELFYVDILSLRLASRSFRQLIDVNEAQIVRHHIKYRVPRHILELYPPPSELNLRFLSGLALRQRLSCDIAQHLAEYISKLIRGRSLTRNDQYRLQYQRMRRRLVPLIFTLFHFFERYRHSLLVETYTGNKFSYGNVDGPIPIQQKIMESYNPAMLLRVSQTYHLLLYLLRQRLAPPNRTFSLARTLSARSLVRPMEDVIVKLLIIGGISQVHRMWNIKNRSRRRKAMEKWISGLQTQGKQENSTELQQSAIDRGESRDSPMILEHDHVPSSFGPLVPRLSEFAIARLIPVLPPLRAIWVPSARELILAKGLDTEDVGIWELFIGELISDDDDVDDDDGDEREYLDEDSGEDPDDSGDENEGMCLDGHTLTKQT